MTDTAPAQSEFQFRIAVRWGDLDAYNHVNNASYLRYLEETRVQWLHTFTSDWDAMGAAPVMAAVQLNYRAPIGWPAELVVTQKISRIGNTSLTIEHRIESADGRVLHADGHVVLVWIDRTSGQPVPLPDFFRPPAPC
ncbi:MAG: acyl-CoA thioesterase [Lysobacteraceae bacterium]|nr:acyl-CoA thioesterase [Xanthomonadaceae bacterium]